MSPFRLGVRVLTPKREVIPTERIQAEVDQRLAQFSGDMINAMANYPPQLPPLRARYRPYRRTGRLGRGWKVSARRRSFVEVSNAVEHAIYVQGPRPGSARRRQTPIMRRKGWQNITDESRRVWARHEPGIASIFTQRGRVLAVRRIR